LARRSLACRILLAPLVGPTPPSVVARLCSRVRVHAVIGLRVADSRAPTCRAVQLLGAMEARYTLACMVVAGNGIPVSKRLLGAAKYSVKLSVGRHWLETSACVNTKGDVYFNQMLRLDNIGLPAEAASIPDVFVHLMRGGTPICYARIKVGVGRGCCSSRCVYPEHLCSVSLQQLCLRFARRQLCMPEADLCCQIACSFGMVYSRKVGCCGGVLWRRFTRSLLRCWPGSGSRSSTGCRCRGTQSSTQYHERCTPAVSSCDWVRGLGLW
jgi:hypothetical protein